MRAKEILTKHKTVVHDLAHALLLIKPTMQTEEIQHIIATSEYIVKIYRYAAIHKRLRVFLAGTN